MKQALIFSLLILLSVPSLNLGHSFPPGKLSSRLWSAYQLAQDSDALHVWIYFADKGGNLGAQYAAVRHSLTPKSRQRRLTVRTPEQLVDFADVPLEENYVAAIRQHVQHVRHSSKWLNAVSVQATKRQIGQIQAFEFVKMIDVVAQFRPITPEPIESRGSPPSGSTAAPTLRALPFDYGQSLAQLDQINVPAVHGLGNFGQGIVIGVFDAGFNRLDHDAFQNMNIVAAHDFVNGDDDVSDGTDMGRFGHHGTGVLSVLGGFAEGQLIGPAFEASYILAKTENHPGSETPVEEDNWIAALEWAEGLGVDIISSSVGYLGFDAPFRSYTWTDMDGQTATITRAAVMAVQRGVVMVNAAGNNGSNPFHNTLMAPADGDGVITAGAVSLDGSRAGFSSVGPTVDGRIKPDVVALGVSVWLASQNDPHEYVQSSGTSFATPLIAGVAALILSAHPDWSPTQVLNALRSTANNSARPDRQIGWGIVDALAAVEFSRKSQAASRQ